MSDGAPGGPGSVGSPGGADGDARLARLERAVDELRREVAVLRAERIAAGAVTPAAEARPAADAEPRPPGPPRPRPTVAIASPLRVLLHRASGRLGLAGLRAERPEDVEALVGRYGTVAVAALLILMGVGAFLTWAIATVRLGPVGRVGLGALAAAALGVSGWRLRTAAADRGTRRFGDLLLALALAVVHVDAWGAGPYLGLVAPGIALAIAAVASGVLAWLAWRERDQTLFVVGTGGALVAPFVTGAAPGHPFVLPIYGWVVVGAALLALPRRTAAPPAGARPWAFAARLLALGVAGYVAATLADAVAFGRTAHPTGGWHPGWEARRAAPALFALATAVTALALAGRVHRTGVALAALASALGALLPLALGTDVGAPGLAALAFVGAATAGVTVERGRRHDAADAREQLPDERPARAGRTAAVAGALPLPLGFLVAALVALPDAVSPAGAAVAAAWTAIGAVSAGIVVGARARAPALDGPLLGAHVAMAGLASALVPVLLLPGAGAARVVALAIHGAATAWLFGRVRERLALLPPVVAVATGAAWAALLLSARRDYAYAPFLTDASLAAAATVAAAAVLGWQARRAIGAGGGPRGSFSRQDGALLTALAPALLVAWGREELAHAVAPDVATALVIGWFALAGITAIALGRARDVATARRVGLALTLYAALKALAQASALDAVGLRVGSYLTVGVFLLAVGFWYRAAGGERSTGEVPAPQ